MQILDTFNDSTSTV